MSTAAALLTLVLASLATYACRALGVVLSSRVSNTGAVFQWVSCVTYAMIAALTSRMIFMPSGVLANVPIWVRVTICLLALLVMVFGRANRLVLALTTGVMLVSIYAHYWL